METLLEFYNQYEPWVLNGLGGVVLGPIISKILRGGAGGGLLGGLGGGLAAGFGADQAALNDVIGNEGTMLILQNLAEGAIGGSVLGPVLGWIGKMRR